MGGRGVSQHSGSNLQQTLAYFCIAQTNTNIIYRVLSWIDTLIQNEHQYFTRLGGSRPISFRRQLKIRDILIEHQSATQLIQHQSEFFPNFTFAVFSL